MPDVPERRLLGASDLEATRAICFDDAFQYEDFAKPLAERRIKVRELHPELGVAPYQAWADKADRHPY